MIIVKVNGKDKTGNKQTRKTKNPTPQQEDEKKKKKRRLENNMLLGLFKLFV